MDKGGGGFQPTTQRQRVFVLDWNPPLSTTSEMRQILDMVGYFIPFI